MSQNTERMVWTNFHMSPTSSVENAYSTNSSSQDSFSSTMSEKVPSPDSTNTPGQPYLKIIEEPINHFRFRYKSEMQGTHGAILGVKATKGEKSYPTVKLFNFDGDAVIRCTLYTAEYKRRRPHVHRLVGKLAGRAEKDDPHDIRITQRDNHTASFQNLVIIHTAKKVLVDELLGRKKRIAEARFTRKLRIEETLLGKMRLEAEQEAKGMNMNSCSLKFEAFTLVNQQYIQVCKPVYSQPINNMKSHVTGQLRICRLSKFYSSCEGGEEILLFVEKVGKSNIKVLFTEFDDYGNEIWRDYATHVDVHHQFGISCRCPKYKSQDISREVLVKMQLERPSDGATSETRDFVYKPGEYNNTATKRRRLDSTAFSPQIPDSTSKPQINTFEPHRPTESCAATSSTVLQSSNTDPLLEIREPLQHEDDFVLFKDSFFSSQVQDEAMHVNTNEENASSSVSFSTEIGKIPTPPESMIPSVFSSEELQRAFQEDVIAPDDGELVPDSLYTRNLKPHSGDLFSDLLPMFLDIVSSSISDPDEVRFQGPDMRPMAFFESMTEERSDKLRAQGPDMRPMATHDEVRFQGPDMRPMAFFESMTEERSDKLRAQGPDMRPMATHESMTEERSDKLRAQGFMSTDEIMAEERGGKVRHQGPNMRPMATHESMTKEDVFLSLVLVGVEFWQSIIASTQKLILRIQKSRSTYKFTHDSDEDTLEGFLNLVFTDGVDTLESAVLIMKPIVEIILGFRPILQSSVFSSIFKKADLWKYVFDILPNDIQELINKNLELTKQESPQSREERGRKKSKKENVPKSSPADIWKPVFEMFPKDLQELLKQMLQSKLTKQPQTSPESRVELGQKTSKKENVPKRSPKVHAKDFAEYTLERLHQIIDTAVFPHVKKSDIETKLLMELETRTAKGESVLHTAVRHQQFKLLRRLLVCIKSHIDDLSPVLNCSNTLNRQTPLHVAVQISNTDQSRRVVEYLLGLGADPNKSDIFEFTPLHLAVKENNLSAAECLLQFPGVNINQVSADLGTALHIAAEENISEMAMLLIRHGADINSIDLQRGQTPLHVAVKRSNVQIVDLLLKQADIDINKEDYRCQTPLKFAVLRADTRLMKIVNKLINHGATYESINMVAEADDSLESVQEDETTTTKSKKMQTLAFLFSQISVTENSESVNNQSEIPPFQYHIVE